MAIDELDTGVAPEMMTWPQYDALAARVFAPFEGLFCREHFDYVHAAPVPYPVRVSYLRWGDPARPVLICLGGVANVARRFDYLAAALRDDFCVVCPDWLGRGHSGWLVAERGYGLPAYVEQTRQLIAHLGGASVALLGSSMGATVAIELAAQEPSCVNRLILNDTGPFIDASTRTARAATLAKHYVFRTQADMFRKLGASQKHDGPLPRSVRLHNAHAQTRWSEEEGGRVYRHDLRAMLAYHLASGNSVVQWAQWGAIACPVLVTRGMESNAFSLDTLERMRDKPGLTVMHVPDTGHTPALADANHIGWIRAWLLGQGAPQGEFSAPYVARG